MSFFARIAQKSEEIVSKIENNLKKQSQSPAIGRKS